MFNDLIEYLEMDETNYRITNTSSVIIEFINFDAKIITLNEYYSVYIFDKDNIIISKKECERPKEVIDYLSNFVYNFYKK